MAATRETFILPKIKCAGCNVGVVLSEMGDHKCVPVDNKQKSDTTRWKAAGNKIPPLSIPRIDLGTSNKPSYGHENLSPPSSASGSRTNSPATPRDGQPLLTPLSGRPYGLQYQNHGRKGSSPNLYSIENPFHTFSPPKSPVRHSIPQVSPLHFARRNNQFAPAPTSNNDNKSVMEKSNAILPGPFGVRNRAAAGLGENRAERPEVLPAVAASFPYRSEPTRPSAEPLPAVAATFPDGFKYDDRPSYGRETYGSIKFGLEKFGLLTRNDEEEPTMQHSMPAPELTERSKVPKALGKSSGSYARTEKVDYHNIPILPSLGFEFKPKKDEIPLGPMASRSEPVKSPMASQSEKLKTPMTSRSEPAKSPMASRSEPIKTPKAITPQYQEAPRVSAEEKLSVIPRSTTSAVKKPPHPGIGLPRNPSVTVKKRQQQKKAFLTKALPPPPDSSPATFDGRRLCARDMASNRSRSPSPGRPRSPPSVDRLPLRTPKPAKKYTYVDLTVENPYKIENLYQIDNRTDNVKTNSGSSTNSASFSDLSKRSESSVSSAPSSDISLTSKNIGPKYVNPKTFDHSQHKKHEILSSRVENEINDSMRDLNKDLNSAPTRVDPPKSTDHQRPAPGRVSPFPTPRAKTSLPTAPQVPPPQFNEPKLRPTTPTPMSDTSENTPTAPLSEPIYPADPVKGHRRAATSKGPCRGCGELIFGKSISSADGRLSGRYHKLCFVCQDCREPFQSVEFYVLDNHPFCHRDYHRNNGSLCRICDHGIEGQCLENDRRERFHPRCFTCFGCQNMLGDDYFEVNGRPFCCEHHAHVYIQRTRPPPPPRSSVGSSVDVGVRTSKAPGRSLKASEIRVERRKTRLMFMDADGTLPAIPLPSLRDGPYGAALPAGY